MPADLCMNMAGASIASGYGKVRRASDVGNRKQGTLV